MLAQAQSVPASAQAFIATRFDMPTVQEDIAYYRRRIVACEAYATAAICLSARRAHEALIRLYGERLAILEPTAFAGAGLMAASDGRGAIAAARDCEDEDIKRQADIESERLEQQAKAIRKAADARADGLATQANAQRR